MHKYKPGDDVGELEFWPFDNPASDYRIVEGQPRTYGRVDQGGDGHTTRYGIWRCTAGTFDCNEQGEELMTVLSGRCRITWLDSGEACDLGPGDTLFIPGASRVRWHVTEDLTKVFYGYKPDGF